MQMRNQICEECVATIGIYKPKPLSKSVRPKAITKHN